MRFINTLTFLATIFFVVSCNKDNGIDSPNLEPDPQETVTKSFSVSETRTVEFAKGNLQYNTQSKEFRFAENQYDIIGKAGNEAQTDWIDLFGWGAWTTETPGNTSTDDAVFTYSNDAETAFASKLNDGNKWRILTKSEWEYLLNGRANASQRIGRATVDGRAGMVLLPDEWTLPEGSNFTPDTTVVNTLSADDWKLLEKNGAVFLPVAGNRRGNEVFRETEYANYWSSTPSVDGTGAKVKAFGFYFREGYIKVRDDNRMRGSSIRFVKVLSGSYKDEEKEEDTDLRYSFTVQTTVADGKENYYKGLTMTFGVIKYSSPLATGVVGEDGKVVLKCKDDFRKYVGLKVWFGVKGMVKFIHELTDEEVSSGTLTLPDKDFGSTVNGKQNDWVVALYMGINKSGEPDGVPLYWATGNLITEKINAQGEASQVVYRIATEAESIEECNAEGGFMRIVREADGQGILTLNTADAYVDMPANTKWNTYQFGDNTGLRLYDMENLKQFVEDTKQKEGDGIVSEISGNKSFDVATQLGGNWRTPTGGRKGNSEVAAFLENVEDYTGEKLSRSVYGSKETAATEGAGFKFDYVVKIDGREICINTLKFPNCGFRHANMNFPAIGGQGMYWTATADPSGETKIYNRESVEVTPYTVAFNFGYQPDYVWWFGHPRTSGMAIRPVIE